jgi:hypothetical protein
VNLRFYVKRSGAEGVRHGRRLRQGAGPVLADHPRRPLALRRALPDRPDAEPAGDGRGRPPACGGSSRVRLALRWTLAPHRRPRRHADGAHRAGVAQRVPHRAALGLHAPEGGERSSTASVGPVGSSVRRPNPCSKADTHALYGPVFGPMLDAAPVSAIIADGSAVTVSRGVASRRFVVFP